MSLLKEIAEWAEAVTRANLAQSPLYDPAHVVRVKVNAMHDICIGWAERDLPATLEREYQTQLWLQVQGDTLYILSIRLRPEQRGKGHGRQLYAITEDIARKLGCAQVKMTPSGTTFRGETRRSYMLRLGYLPDGVEVAKPLYPPCPPWKSRRKAGVMEK